MKCHLCDYISYTNDGYCARHVYNSTNDDIILKNIQKYITTITNISHILYKVLEYINLFNYLNFDHVQIYVKKHDQLEKVIKIKIQELKNKIEFYSKLNDTKIKKLYLESIEKINIIFNND